MSPGPLAITLTLAALLPGPTSVAAAERPSLTTDARPGASTAKSYGIWTPSRFDSCSAALHDRYAARGPGGKLYPGWHPPVVRDPVSDKRCGFGHEHGRDPRGSDLYGWIARHFGGGLPFGAANEALDAYAAAHPEVSTRHEDHVGHKVEWQNDVRLRGVTCDFLTKVHQGTHSADAFANNVHELIYAVRCDDGTRLLTTTLARFGRSNGFARGCQPAASILTGAALSFPSGRGARSIPDRACVERDVLVPPGRYSRLARGLYESWTSTSRLTTRGGRLLAEWRARFGVFDPSRYYDPRRPGGLARTVDTCGERTTDGSRASGSACDVATDFGRNRPVPFDDPRSPFDGSHRETSFGQTRISNIRARGRWYSDPYGRRASGRPFPGALCQLVGPTGARRRLALPRESFGAERPYGGRGVHAPN